LESRTAESDLTLFSDRYKTLLKSQLIILGGAVNAVKPGDANVAPDAWMAGIESAEFKALVDAKQRAIVPMVVIYIVGYLGLSILAGFGRTLLGTKVVGSRQSRLCADRRELSDVVVARRRLCPAVGQSPRSPGQTCHRSRCRQPEAAMNPITIAMFVIILLVSLGITVWAARRTRTTSDFYAAGKGLTAAQNGFALAGDWCSAAAFLGFTGLTALYGMDGALYAVGPLVAFCTVLLLIAEPLRNTGTYTIGDVIMYRMRQPPALAAAIVGTIIINLAYLIPQMAGAGVLIKLLFGIPYSVSVMLVGLGMIVYVAAGGMLATSWVHQGGADAGRRRSHSFSCTRRSGL
jgi:Sodium:solute symporter family/Protein of unknown function, DUF485